MELVPDDGDSYDFGGFKGAMRETRIWGGPVRMRLLVYRVTKEEVRGQRFETMRKWKERGLL